MWMKYDAFNRLCKNGESRMRPGVGVSYVQVESRGDYPEFYAEWVVEEGTDEEEYIRAAYDYFCGMFENEPVKMSIVLS